LKVLFDHNVPKYLTRLLAVTGHEVQTARQMGWERLVNGMLLTAAVDAGFDVLITRDGGFRHQQNLEGRTLAVILLVTPQNEPLALNEAMTRAISTFDNLVVGKVYVVEAS